MIADQAVWAVCGRQGAVVSLTQNNKQNIVVEVMPLIGGHLSLPSIRLSKVLFLLEICFIQTYYAR